MKKMHVLLAPVVAAIFGCASPVPVADNFPLSFQKVARTAHHWDVVADDVVTQTLQTISEKQQLQGRGVYVSPSRSTAFNVAFRDFMITRLVDRGATVSACRAENKKSGFYLDAPDVEIQYETRIIRHGDNLPLYKPGVLTALASGVAVLHNAGETLHHGEVYGASIVGAALLDWGAGHAANPTRTELIVTTTIVENNRILMHRNDIYYVPDSDAALFFQRVAQRSACPGEKVAIAEPANERGVAPGIDGARSEQIVRDMRRVNPEWRGVGFTVPTAWAY